MSAYLSHFKPAPKQAIVNLKQLNSSVASKKTILNYTLDDASDLVHYGAQTSDECEILRSGALLGCHLVIGLIKNRSFLAHNVSFIAIDDVHDLHASGEIDRETQGIIDTINIIKENPSGSYYFFFTTRSFELTRHSPESYIQTMEKNYGVDFKQAFYYDDKEVPIKNWVEASYNHKTGSLDVAGFQMRWTGQDIEYLKHSCESIILDVSPPLTLMPHC